MMKNYKWRIKNDDVLFFLHIPKTGGTTFYEMLLNLFPNYEQYKVPDQDSRETLVDLYPNQLDNVKVVRQHFGYNFYKYLPRKPIYLTFLRHPVSRLHSLYKHIKRVDNHKFHDQIVKENVSFLEFMQGDFNVTQDNAQVNMLSGLPVKHASLRPKDAYEISKMRLIEFAFFGFQEHYDESVKLFFDTFDLEKIDYKPLNVAPTKSGSNEIEKKAVELVEEKNEYDIKLYNFAVELFKKRVGDL
jgi:hypothetical protein